MGLLNSLVQQKMREDGYVNSQVDIADIDLEGKLYFFKAF